MLRGELAADQHVNGKFRTGEKFFAEDPYFGGCRGVISSADHGESGFLRVSDLAIAVHSNQIRRAQIAERPRLFAARGNFRHGDIFEDGLECMEQVEVLTTRRLTVCSDEHFLRAATPGD